MGKDRERLQKLNSDKKVSKPKPDSSDEKMRILSEIASRKKSTKLRKNLVTNLIYVITSLALTAVMAFGVLLMFGDKTHKVAFYVDTHLLNSVNVKNESVLDEDLLPLVDESAYEFDGKWYTNPRGVGDPHDFNKPITNSLSLYAGVERRSVELKIFTNDNRQDYYYSLQGKYGDLVNILDEYYFEASLFKENYNLIGFDPDKDATTPKYGTGQLIGLYEGELFAIWHGKPVDIPLSGKDAQYIISERRFEGKTIYENYASTYIVNVEEFNMFCKVETGASVKGIRVIKADGSQEEKSHGAEIIIENDMLFELCFEEQPNKLTIIFDNGSAPKTYLGMQTIAFPNVTKNHYLFQGYNGNKEGENNKVIDDEILIEGDITYTAQWENAIYKITLNAEGVDEWPIKEFYQKYEDGFYFDEFAETPLDVIGDEGGRHIIDLPEREGYIFEGFYLRQGTNEHLAINKDGEFSEDITATTFIGNTTLNARFTKKSYTVTFDNDNKFGTIHAVSGTVVDYGGAFTFTITLKPEYQQNYDKLLSYLQEYHSVTQETEGAVTPQTRFRIENITSDITLDFPEDIPLNKYEVRWLNYDGSVVVITDHEHGSLPAFPDNEEIDIPMRDGDGEISFEFIGWDKVITHVIANTSYTARYKGIIQRPLLINDKLEYSGSPQAPTIEGSEYYQLIVTPQINAGKYTGANAANISLKVQTGFTIEWEGGSNLPLLLEWEITKATVERPEINGAPSFVYNGKDQYVDISGYDESIMTITGNFAKNVGTHSVNISFTTNNYTWSDGGTEAITYGWSITAATLIVKVKDVEKIYDGTQYVYDGNPATSKDLIFENLQGDDTPASALSGRFSFYGGTTADVGTHPIQLNAESINIINNNYTLDLVEGFLTILHIVDVKKPTLLQTEFEYTGDNITITDSFDQLFQADIMQLSDDISAKDTGEYTVTLTLNKNYQWDDEDENVISFTWYIYKTTLTITADDKEKTYGDVNPQFTYQYQGLKDSVAVLDVIALTSTATTTSDVGVYDIVLEYTPTLNNYEIQFHKGSLTINVKLLDEPYAKAEDVVLTYTGSTQYLFVQGFDDECMNMIGNSGTNADNYEATITLKNTNYQWSSQGTDAIYIQWEIIKAKIGLPAVSSDISFEYNTDYQGLTFTPNQPGDDQLYSIDDNAKRDVGEYTTRVSLIDTNNYEWQNHEGEVVENPLTFIWNIYPKKLEVPTISGDDSFEYSGVEQEIQLTYFDYQLIIVTGNVQKDAGEHVINFSLADSANYTWDDDEITDKTINWYITKALLKVKVVSTSVEYSLAIPTFELEFIDFKGDDNAYNSINGDFSTTTDATPGTDVGIYEVELHQNTANSNNYDFELINGELEIIEKQGTIKPMLAESTFIYTGSTIVPELLDFNSDIMEIHTESDQSARNVGEYSIAITLDKNHAWEDLGEKSFTLIWDITPATLTITAENKTKIYKEDNPALTYVISGLLGIDTEDVIIGEIELTTTAHTDSPVNDSPYDINITDNLTAQNYNIERISGELTITYRLLTKPVISGAYTFQYDDEEKELQFDGFDASTMAVTENKATSAGEYNAKITLLDKANYKWADSSDDDLLFQWWILEAMLGKPYIESNLIYSTQPQTPNVLPDKSGDEVYYQVIAEPKVNVGTYYVTVELTNENYVWDDGTNNHLYLEWKIHAQKVIIPTASGAISFVYNGYEQELQLDNFDAETVQIVSESNLAKDVGNYNVEIALKDNINYVWDDAESTIENKTIAWRITKATLYVTANDKTMVYGDELPVFDVSYENFLGDDDETSISGAFEFIGSATEVTSTSNIGVYDIVIASNLPFSQNYTFDITNGKLTIVAKEGIAKPTLEIEEHQLEYVAQSINIINELTNYNSDIMASTGDIARRNVGKYTITITLDNNHEWEDKGDKSFEIEWEIIPVDLIITAEDVTRLYKQENPIFTYSIVTLLGDDEISDVIENFELVTSATANSNIGDYEINIAGSQVSNNYNVTRIDGTLFVDPLPLTRPTVAVTSFVYNESEHTLDIQNFDAESMNITGNSAIDADSYKAIISLKTNNYTWSDGQRDDISFDWEITKANVKEPILTSGTSFEFNNSTHMLLFEESEQQHLYTINDNAGVIVGDYTTIIYLNDDNNYMWEQSSLSTPIQIAWNIYAQALNIPQITGDSVFDYNGEIQEIALNNIVNDIMTVTGNQYKNANDYTVTISLNDTLNYVWSDETIADITLPWTIEKIKLTVSANNVSMDYSGTTYTFNGNPQNSTDLTFAGFVQGDDKYNSITGSFAFAGEAVTAIEQSGDNPYIIEVTNGTAEAVNYYFEFVSGELTINPLGNITKPTLSQSEFVYTGIDIDIEPYILNFYATILGDDAMSILPQSDLVARNVKTDGQYEIIISLGDNFKWATEEGEPNNENIIITWNITPAPLTLQANNTTKVYQEENPMPFSFEVYGLRGEDLPTIITSVEYGEEAKTAEDVGDYTIEIISHTTTSANYTVAYMPGTLTITHKIVNRVMPYFESFVYNGNPQTLLGEWFVNFDALYMEITNNVETNAGNYTAIVSLLPNYAWEGVTFDEIEIDWEITKATVHAPTVTSSNLVYNGELQKVTIAPNSLYTISNDIERDAGVYWAVVTLNDANNYAWYGELESSDPIELEWEIARYQLQSVIISTESSLIYTGAEQTFEISNYDSDLIDVTGNKQKDVGVYTVTISIIDKVNYCWEDQTDYDVFADWYITRATLFVKANDATIEYLQDIPTFTVSISNFLENDTQENSITGEFSIFTYAIVGSPVNQYPIIAEQGEAYSKNYQFAFQPGVLTITPLADVALPTLTQAEFYYIGANITPEIENLRSDIMEVVGDTVARNVLPYDSDRYIITITLNSNYSWADQEANQTITLEWKINKVTLTVTADNKTKIYGNANPPLTYEVVGLVGSDTESAIGNIQLATDASTNSDVGDYDIYFVNPLSSGNYDITITEATLTITHRIFDKPIIGQPTTFVYDGYLKALNITGFDGSAMNIQGNSATNSGIHTLTISLQDKKNYTWADGSTDDIVELWEILKVYIAKPEVIGTLTYNGSNQSPNIATSPYYSISNNVETDAGNYTARVALNDKTNLNYIWEDGTSEDVLLQWEILHAVLTRPTMRDVTYVYNGSEQTLQLNNFDASTMNIVGNAYKNAHPEYLATISLKDIKNYVWDNGEFTTITFTWAIGKAQLTVRAIDKTMVYSEAVPAFEVSYEGFVTGDNASNSITGNFQFTGSAASVTSTSNVGDYDIVVSTTGVTSTNYQFNLVHGKLSILPLGGITKPTLSKNLFDYIGANIDIKNHLNNFDSSIMTITNDIKRDAGTYTVTITIDNNHNWEGGGARSFNLNYTISKVNLTITADNKTKIYGSSNPALTYVVSGQVGSDIGKPLNQIISGTIALSTSATTNSNVSTYAITFNSTPTSANYNVLLSNGVLTITHKLLTKPSVVTDAFTYDGSTKSIAVNGFDSASMNVSGNTGVNAGNYTAVYSLRTTNYKWADGSTANVLLHWTIARAKITKPSIIGSSSFVYNGSVHTPTVATNSLYTISGNLSATNAGNYNIIITIKDKSNYSWADNTDANLSLPWTITARSLTIPTVSGASTFEYNASERQLALNNFDSNTMNVTGNKYKNAGNYNVVISLKNTINYKWSDNSVSNKSIAWSITKATLTITANNKTMTYGDSLPAFDVTYSGFKTGDTASSSITGSFTLTTTATSNSSVGSYNIVVGIGSAKSTNYNLVLVNGKLTINERGGVAKPTLKTTSFTYTAVTITPEILGFNASNMQRSGDLSARNVASYSIVVTLDANHAWQGGGAKSITLSWEIKPATLTVTAQNKSKTYGAANPALTYSVATLLGSDTISTVFSGFSVTTSATTNSNVGTYDIVINGTQISNNYTVTRVKGTLTINHKLITKPRLTGASSFTYDGALKTIGVTGYDSATMNVSNNTATNAGAYNAVYSLKSTNYRWADGSSANVTFTWVINKITVAKPTASGSRTYNGSSQSPVIPTSTYYTISGNSGTNAGSYTAKVVLKDKNNYSWTDGTNSDLSLSWSIAKYTPTMNTQSGTYAYIYGQLLNSKTISETARGVSGNIAGAFTFVSPSSKPTTSTTSVQIRFTPSDTINYNVATFSLKISVTQIGITFVSNGGSAVAKINGEYNQNINKPTDPTRSHYTFAGWFRNSGLTTAVTWPHRLTANVTFYAKWTPVKYTVSFSTSTSNGTRAVAWPNNANTVTIASSSVDYNANYTFNLNSSPFAGLYRKSNGAAITGLQINGSGTVYTSTIRITGNITLTFAFSGTANSSTINYNGGSTSGTGSGQSNSVYYGIGTNLNAVDVKKEFYILKGYATQNVAWNNGNLGGSIPLYTRAQMNTRKVTSGTVTYYAIWEPITVRFTYNANGGSGSASGGASTRFGTSSFALAARGSLARTYYTYTGWAKTSGGAKVHNASAAINVNATFLKDSSYTKTNYVIGNSQVTFTLYANWSRNQTTLNFIFTPGSGAPASRVFNSGASISTGTALAPTSWTRTGYTFDGWSLSSGGSKIASTWTVPASTTTLYARWVARTFTITFNANSGSGGPSSRTATYGSAMPSASPAPTRTGYTFQGYYDTSASSGGTRYYTSAMGSSRTWNKTSNTTLYARWTARTFTITFNANGGSGVPSSRTATYGSAMPSASPAPTRTGYTFQGYYDTSASSGGTRYYTASMGSSRTWNKTANTTLYARWTARTTTISFNANGGSGGPSSRTATYGSAMPSASPAPTRTGYTFQGYYDTSAASGGTRYYTASMGSSRTWNKTATSTTLYARWTGNQYTVTLDKMPVYDTSTMIVPVGSDTGYATHGKSGTEYAVISPVTQNVTMETYRYSAGHGNPALVLYNHGWDVIASNNSHTLFHLDARITYRMTANTVYYFNVWAQSSTTRCYVEVRGATHGTGNTKSTVTVRMGASYNLGTAPSPPGRGSFAGWFTENPWTQVPTSGTWNYAGNRSLNAYFYS